MVPYLASLATVFNTTPASSFRPVLVTLPDVLSTLKIPFIFLSENENSEKLIF